MREPRPKDINSLPWYVTLSSLPESTLEMAGNKRVVWMSTMEAFLESQRQVLKRGHRYVGDLA